MITCPHCSAQVVNSGALAGRVVTCAACGGQFQLPMGAAFQPGPPAIATRPPNRGKAGRSSNASVWIAAAAIAGLLAVAVIAVAFLASPRASGIIKHPFLSPEERAVDQYLRENLPSPSYEVILREGPFDSTEWDGKRVRLVRLKYRAENLFGGRHVDDRVFTVDSGKVETVREFNDSYFARRDSLAEWCRWKSEQGSP